MRKVEEGKNKMSVINALRAKSWPACSPSSKEMNFILLFTLKKLAKP